MYCYLIVVARVAAKDRGEARRLLKRLVDDIRETLLRDPRLYRCAETGRVDVIRIPRLRSKLMLQGESETNIGEAVLTFPIEYDDAFPQRVATPLAQIVSTWEPRSTATPLPSGPTEAPVPFTVTIPLPAAPAPAPEP